MNSHIHNMKTENISVYENISIFKGQKRTPASIFIIPVPYNVD